MLTSKRNPDQKAPINQQNINRPDYSFAVESSCKEEG
jgi:hypothetical protein